MALFLLNLIFCSLKLLASYVTFIVFRAVAVLVVVLIQAFRIPGQAIECALDNFASLLRIVLEYVFELVKDALVSQISSGFDILCGTATGSVGLTASAVLELLDKARSVATGLAEIFPEAFGGMSEMVGEVVMGLWSNYKDAVEYVMQNS